MAEDVKQLRKTQREGGITFSGKIVEKACEAVKYVGRRGTTLLKAEG